MASAIASLIAGLVFGLGLILSGMGNPAKVQNFLDFFGAWDPSLAFVMGGAILVGLVAFTWARKRKTSLLGDPMQLPSSTAGDKRLLTGAALFGIGWGIAGYCPGPALANLAHGGEAVAFVVAMLAGSQLARLLPTPP